MSITRVKTLVLALIVVILAFAAIFLKRDLDRTKTALADLEERYFSRSTELEIVTRERASIRSEYDGVLEDLESTSPELAKRLQEQRKAAEEARANEAEAIRQQRQAERSREVAEDAQHQAEKSETRTREALDSLATEKRETDRLNRQKSASLVAQNSMSIKGDPQLRGLMAVYAQQALERSGGDVNNQEVVDALKGALDVLQLGAEPGIPMTSVARSLRTATDGKLLAMGDDARVLHVDVRTWRTELIRDLSAELDRMTGKAFLVSGGDRMVIADERGIRVHATSDGALIASVKRTPHTDRVRAAAILNGKEVLVTGDLNGVLAVWKMKDKELELIGTRNQGGKFRALAEVPGAALIAGIDGTSALTLIDASGAITTLSLPENTRAWSLAVPGRSHILIGAQDGSLWSIDPLTRKTEKLFKGRGQQVECLAHDARTGAIAWVDKTGALSVTGRVDAAGTKEFRMQVPQIPNAMCFGQQDNLYLSSADGIRPVLWSSRSMAHRICELVGRNWTADEWKQHIGQGTPEPTCAGF